MTGSSKLDRSWQCNTPQKMQFLTAETPQTSKRTLMGLIKNILFLMGALTAESVNKVKKLNIPTRKY